MVIVVEKLLEIESWGDRTLLPTIIMANIRCLAAPASHMCELTITLQGRYLLYQSLHFSNGETDAQQLSDFTKLLPTKKSNFNILRA